MKTMKGRVLELVAFLTSEIGEGRQVHVDCIQNLEDGVFYMPILITVGDVRYELNGVEGQNPVYVPHKPIRKSTVPPGLH